jgi:AcrR family transcriptional regulator
MSTQTELSPQPRLPLSRERVLRAAIRLADEGGFESLTMRRLGDDLGVQAMSLYNHVANKEDIRAGIVDLVLSEVEVPTDTEDWKTAIRQSAISAHDALVRHRWASGLMMATAEVSPSRLRWMEWVLRTLREAGFTANQTHHAYHALDSHITGSALWQASFPFPPEQIVDVVTAFRRQVPADEFPYLDEHVEQHLAPARTDDPSEFEFGLDLILDGLERIRDSA